MTRANIIITILAVVVSLVIGLSQLITNLTYIIITILVVFVISYPYPFGFKS